MIEEAVPSPQRSDPVLSGQAPNDGRVKLLLGACMAMLLFGIVLAVLGLLFGLPETRQRLAVSPTGQGDLFLCLYGGVFLSTLLVGPAIDSRGNKPVLMLSSIVVSAGLLLLALARSYETAIAASVVLGLGGGGLNTSANALVSDLYPLRRGAMLNLVASFYGVGALLLPLLAALIRGWLTVSQLLLWASALAALSGVAFGPLAFPPPAQSTGVSMLASLQATRTPGVLLLGLLLFCQSGNEAVFGGWASAYAGSMGASPRTATWILTAYWAALTAGRIVGARVAPSRAGPRLVLASAIGSALGIALFLASRSMVVTAAGAVVTGFSFATIYPTTLAVAGNRYQRAAGTIFGLLFAIGLCGGMILPWLVGHLSSGLGLRAAMTVLLAGALVISMIAAVQSRR